MHVFGKLQLTAGNVSSAKNYLTNGSTAIPFPSFWNGYTLRTAGNYWEHWPLASSVRLLPTRMQNETKISVSRIHFLSRPSGGRRSVRMLPLFGAKLLDLEFLASAVRHKIQWLFTNALYSVVDCALTSCGHTVCTTGLIKILSLGLHDEPSWECATINLQRCQRSTFNITFATFKLHIISASSDHYTSVLGNQ